MPVGATPKKQSSVPCRLHRINHFSNPAARRKHSLTLALAQALALALTLGSELVLGSKMESNDVAKRSHERNLGALFSLINMDGMAELARCKG